MYHDQPSAGLGQQVQRQPDLEGKRIAAMEYERQMKQAAMSGALPRELSTMDLALSGVGSGLDEAFCALDRLSSRLQMVLQPEYPQPATMAGNAGQLIEQPRSDAVCRLHSLRAQIEILVSRINGLSARLDT